MVTSMLHLQKFRGYMGGSMGGYSISPVPFTMLLFSRINVPNVSRGLDFHMFPLRAQKMVKLCDAWNKVLFVGQLLRNHKQL